MEAAGFRTSAVAADARGTTRPPLLESLCLDGVAASGATNRNTKANIAIKLRVMIPRAEKARVLATDETVAPLSGGCASVHETVRPLP